MGKGGRYTIGSGLKYHIYKGRYTIYRGCQQTMGRGVDISWLGGSI